jgi:hypothetical protein
MTSEVEISGNVYVISRLPARKQLHIARRLLPVAESLIPLLANAEGTVNIFDAMGAMADTVGKLPDDEVDYIIDHCLEAVKMKSGMGFHNVVAMTPQGSRPMFEHVDDMAIQLRLVFEVIKENLSNFSFDLLLPSPGAIGTQT